MKSRYELTLGFKNDVEELLDTFNVPQEVRLDLKAVIYLMTTNEAIHARLQGYKEGVRMVLNAMHQQTGQPTPKEVTDLLEREL